MSTPHCKEPDHLRVISSSHSDDGPVTATFVAQMACHNAPTGPGIVLSRHASDPMRGIHLLPGAVDWLPGELATRAASTPAGQCVTLEHFEDPNWLHAFSVKPAEAIALAATVRQLAQQHGI